LSNVFRVFFRSIFKKKAEIQTVPIEEYNKAKQALQDANNRILTLTKANEDIIKDNDITLAETEYLQYEMRIEQIASILSTLNITDKERSKLLQTLANSDLTIEFIAETYAPITKKNIIIETKLPQKSISDKIKDLSYLT
jgi:hypothetical protein